MKSLKEKLQQLIEARDVVDFDEWTDNFLATLEVRMKNNGWNTTTLSEKQVDIIDRKWEKYCAD